MRAKDISGLAPGGKRTPLSKVLPLETPFVVQIFPVYACNFKCGYCIFSVKESKRHFITDAKVMELSLYKKCIDDIAKFASKIKVLRFVGIGEPLLHRHIAEMVEYAASKGVANTIEIITNASLLTEEISRSLIAAGLNRLVISVQGTTEKKYKEVSQVNIKFDTLIDRIRYFYNNRSNTHVYIKIVDCALDGEGDKQRFFDIFGDICDTIGIEYAVPIHSGVNFDEVLKDGAKGITQFGLSVSEVQICPQPFFTMQINPDGKVVPCYSFEYPGIMGDCNGQAVTEIWDGPKFKEFRHAMLDGLKQAGKVCADCSIIKYRMFPEDELNDNVDRLKSCYKI